MVVYHRLDILMDIVGLLVFVVSVALATLELYKSHLKISACEAFIMDSTKNIFISLVLSNRSNYPFSIADVSMTICGDSLSLDRRVFTIGKTTSENPILLASILPISVNTFESQQIVLSFRRPPESNSKLLQALRCNQSPPHSRYIRAEFRFLTSRGEIRQKILLEPKQYASWVRHQKAYQNMQKSF